MRQIDEPAIEHHRSAKVIGNLEQAGVSMSGGLLDAGCGGGMPVSFAEEAQSVAAVEFVLRLDGRGRGGAR